MSWATSGSALPPDVRRWLCPAVEVLFRFWAMPLVRPLAQNKSEGLSPNQGHSPGIIWLLLVGHSHHVTSGGKAEAAPTKDFYGKAVRADGKAEWSGQ